MPRFFSEIFQSGKVVKLNRAPYCELCGKQTWTATIREKSQAKENEEKRKNMQQKAFTVWINHHLKQSLGESAPQVENLNSDLSTGVLLIELIASVYNVKKPNYNKKPTLYAHYLDNVSIALKMLETAGIKMPFLKAQSKQIPLISFIYYRYCGWKCKDVVWIVVAVSIRFSDWKAS